MKLYVSVIVPAYHDWERLKICIDALLNQTYPQENFEVIIVNNDPADTPPDLSLPENFRIISEEKPGSYAARNAGIKKAKGEILAFTDADCIPEPGWIKEGIKVFNSDKRVSRVGGKVDLFFKNKRLTIAEIYEKAFAFRQQRHVEKSGTAVTANMFSKRKVFESVGMFDENKYSGEDIEWGIRAQKRGFKIKYSAMAIVKHPARHTLKQLFSKSRRIAGGLADSVFSNKNKIVVILKGFFPPVYTLRYIINNQDLKFQEKIISFFTLYLIKICRNIFLIKFLVSPQNKPRT